LGCVRTQFIGHIASGGDQVSDQLRTSNAGVVGSVLAGRYELLELIGSGGMGAVYKARQLDMDSPVAIKLLIQDSAPDVVALKRLQSEGRALASLSHRAIPKVFCIEQLPNGSIFLAMDLIDGISLDKVLEARQKLPLSEVVPMFVELADALGHAHSHGIIHRDLKPSNIMVTERDGVRRYYLLDFGIAKNIQSSQKFTQTGALVGTVRYMSPEQASGAPLGPESDIYSLACVIYETLTGHPLFDAESQVELLMKHVHDTLPRMDLPELKPVADVLIKALAKKAEDRFADMRAFSDALQSPETLVSSQVRHRSRLRIPPKIVISLLCVLLCACVTAVVISSSRRDMKTQFDRATSKQIIDVLKAASVAPPGDSRDVDLAYKQLMTNGRLMTAIDRKEALEAAVRWLLNRNDKRALDVWKQLEPLYRELHESPGATAVQMSFRSYVADHTGRAAIAFLEPVAQADKAAGVDKTPAGLNVIQGLASHYMTARDPVKAREMLVLLADAPVSDDAIQYSEAELSLAEIDTNSSDHKNGMRRAQEWLKTFGGRQTCRPYVPWALGLIGLNSTDPAKRREMFHSCIALADSSEFAKNDQHARAIVYSQADRAALYLLNEAPGVADAVTLANQICKTADSHGYGDSIPYTKEKRAKLLNELKKQPRRRGND
jgi:serine/threonine protein kinase